MDSIKWANVMAEIRTGNQVICPFCGNGTIQAEYAEIEFTEGTIFLQCDVCGKISHFSHQKPLN